MPDAQPGQEQRMELDDRKVDRVRRMTEAMRRDAWNDEERGAVEALDHVLALTRPTADLGEDGENKRLPSESTMDAAARILGAPDHRAFLAIATKSNKRTLNAVCQMLGILERLLGVLDRPHIIILDGEQHLDKARVFGEARAAIGKGQG